MLQRVNAIVMTSIRILVDQAWDVRGGGYLEERVEGTKDEGGKN